MHLSPQYELNICHNVNSITLYRLDTKAINNLGCFIGRKGIEPSTALTIEFTAQAIIPRSGTFLFNIK